MLAYAHDIAILTRDKLNLIRAFCGTVKEAKKRGLETSEKKTKVMCLTGNVLKGKRRQEWGVVDLRWFKNLDIQYAYCTAVR